MIGVSRCVDNDNSVGVLHDGAMYIYILLTVHLGPVGALHSLSRHQPSIFLPVLVGFGFVTEGLSINHGP